jgi:transcriptional regulator with XRE-family HTH domain
VLLFGQEVKIMVNVGQNIAAARKRAGMTQEELAAKVGYQTKSAINKIELGIRDLPQKKIAAFADALGVTPGHLMGWDAEPEDLGAVAARVLMEPSTLQMVQDFLTLDGADKLAVCTLVASLAAKNKKD